MRGWLRYPSRLWHLSWKSRRGPREATVSFQALTRKGNIGDLHGRAQPTSYADCFHPGSQIPRLAHFWDRRAKNTQTFWGGGICPPQNVRTSIFQNWGRNSQRSNSSSSHNHLSLSSSQHQAAPLHSNLPFSSCTSQHSKTHWWTDLTKANWHFLAFAEKHPRLIMHGFCLRCGLFQCLLMDTWIQTVKCQGDSCDDISPRCKISWRNSFL